jgi:GNAT superfamily N-acetyltransferase
MSDATISYRPATADQVPVILGFIRALAEYEKMPNEVQATEERLRETLFGPNPAAECILAMVGEQPVGFAIFFHNYSTFLARRGLYLEDLFVAPEWRGRGIGVGLLRHLAKIAVERDCGRMDWVVLDWNSRALELYEEVGALVMHEWRTCRLSGESLRRAATAEPQPDPAD